MLGGLKSAVRSSVFFIVKRVLYFIGLLLLSSTAHGQLHAPTWQLVDDQNMSSFDMLTTRSGLIAINYNGVHTLTEYVDGVLNGIYIPSAPITSIIIRDANVAYLTVKGDGIFEASNNWKDVTRILKSPNTNLFSVFGAQILANIGGTLNYSNDAFSFQPGAGIKPGDTVLAAEFLTSEVAIAVTGNVLYRSVNGGSDWLPINAAKGKMTSIYVDRSNSIIYVGGSQVMRSLDQGKSWDSLSSIFFTLSGTVVGTRDCSGVFYLGPDAVTHGSNIYRSADHGRTLQQAGASMLSSVRMKKGVILDRGSTFFYLDSSGLLGVVRDGIDSVITDSVKDHLIIQPETGVRNSLCAGATLPTEFSVSLGFNQCTGIILDSLKQIKTSKSFSAKFAQDTVSDSTINISFTFHATHEGWDTAHYRLKFHSPTTGNIEQRFFDVVGFGAAGSPTLGLDPNGIDFAKIALDSIGKRSLAISNTGCDTLVLDTIFSTNSSIFTIESKKYPLKIASGKSIQFSVSFLPHLAGDYLESLQIETNTGTRFATLRGIGKAPVAAAVMQDASENKIRISPNPANEYVTISSTSALAKRLILRDQLGREITRWETDEALILKGDIRNIANGYYIFDLGQGKFERIIIQH